MRRIFAQSRKELTQIIRDWRTLALALFLPLVLLLPHVHRAFAHSERLAHHCPGSGRLAGFA